MRHQTLSSRVQIPEREHPQKEELVSAGPLQPDPRRGRETKKWIKSFGHSFDNKTPRKSGCCIFDKMGRKMREREWVYEHRLHTRHSTQHTMSYGKDRVEALRWKYQGKNINPRSGVDKDKGNWVEVHDQISCKNESSLRSDSTEFGIHQKTANV